jgi:branched-chain amino acid transport system ATP-binding protein
MSGGPLLELAGVYAGYGPIRVLHDVSISVAQGQIVSLLGANGAGKTTTLRSISGTVGRTGTIRLDGRSIARLAPEQVAGLGVAHVPEGRGTLGEFTVAENLRIAAHARRDRTQVARDMDRVFNYFPALASRTRQPAGTLSGGEQQMLALGRALLSKPRLLLLDEPSFGLAPRMVQGIFEIIETINREEGVAVVLVEQNASLALGISRYGYVLEVGRIAVQGSSEELRQDESVRRSYLGY